MLIRTFAALDEARIRWCLLRGDDELDGTGQDIDLLVHPRDRRDAEDVLVRLGFGGLQSWGRGTHRFYLAYEPRDDAWFKIDSVTNVAFGPSGELDTGTADALLRRRTHASGLWRLAPSDGFWALLLHCILDRGSVPERHAAALLDLAPVATGDSPLAEWFGAHAPAAWTPERVIGAAGNGNWAPLIDVGSDLVRSESRSVRRTATRLGRLAARRMTKLRKILLERGLSVALMGPDGAGKSTVANGIGQSFYFPVRPVYMGLFSKDRISGKAPAGGIEHVTRLAGHLSRQWKAYVRALGHRARGRLVVYDRFGYDAILREPRRSWIGGRLRRWILAHAVPAPDLVIVLDAPADVLMARKGEHDLATLEDQRQSYLRLAARIPNAHVVRTDRSADEIRREVVSLIWRRYLTRRTRRSRSDG